MKILVKLLTFALISSFWVVSASAQSNSFDLKKAADQYKSSGTVSITKAGTKVSYSIVVKDLPSPLPNAGVYYLVWALTPEGKAANLGPITNNSELVGTFTTKANQIFISSEKERFPEYVQGPRIVQTDTIPATVFDTMTTSTPTPKAVATDSAVPIGGPTGAPETGFGGSILINGVLISLSGIGGVGLLLSLRNKFLKQ